MSRTHQNKPVLRSLLIAGAGLIGSYLGPLVARLPGIRGVRIIDRDSYSASNSAQDILPSHVGKPKAQVLARRIREINPSLQVEAIHADIVDVPLGTFRCDLILAGLDSRQARMLVNERAWWLGVPWIDAGVGHPLLVRVTVFVPGVKSACYECGLDEKDYASDQRYPCQEAVDAPATNSPAHLGALAAALQATECSKFLNGQVDPALPGRQLILDAQSRRIVETLIPRRASCRFHHGALTLQPEVVSPRQATLAEVFELAPGEVKRNGAPVSLVVPGKHFVGRVACSCGYSRPVLRLQGRVRSRGLVCPRCSERMTPVGFHTLNSLSSENTSAAQQARSLSALGLQAGDIITVTRGNRSRSFELRANSSSP